MSIDLGSQHLPMQNDRATPAEPISNNVGSQQFLLNNKRMTQAVPALISPGSQQIANPNKRMTQMLSMPKNLGSQQSSLLNKRMAHVEPVPTNLGSPHSSTSNKRNAPMGPSPKGQSESSESVRVKLRESLADSLTLVCKSQKQAVGSDSQGETVSTLKTCNENPGLADITATSSDVSSCHMPEKSAEDDNGAQKVNSSQISSQEVLVNDIKVDVPPTLKTDGPDFQFNYVLLDEDVSFDNNFFVKDELLQGNGLCWVSDLEIQTAQSEKVRTPKRPKVAHEDGDGTAQPSPQDLAKRIEAELFKLYGGVNKKYKEKGRSLLFNLKDRNNPELRERVMSGEIAPGRLCSMTAEELASKELSEWRIAKAEEYAQMVVLPDSSADVRRLVKKTHKGEFQVEFEQDDGASTEVAASSLYRPITNDEETRAAAKSIENTASEAGTQEKLNSEDQSPQSSLSTLPDDGTDLMQGLMVDELKDADFLPPIVSLDEFMESLDAEPPFENLPVDSGTANMNSDENDDSHISSKLESSNPGSTDVVDTALDNLDKEEVRHTKVDTGRKSGDDIGEPETSTTITAPIKHSKPNLSHRESEQAAIISTPKKEHVWEGLLQLNVSSMVTVVGNFKSGERTSAKEWTSFLDVKGRVRLDPFEKFLQELPKSRSRAIMIVHFSWKEGSPESGLVNLCEVIDSYVADERVGFAEPAPGVELYLCPPHGKISEILRKHLSKDHIETLNSINEGLVGIVVWRKAHVTSTVSPDSSSHHKHNARKQHYSSVRRQQDENSNTNIFREPPLPRGAPPTNPEPPMDDESMDDIPPGFGPGVAREEEDLPEFDYAGGSNTGSHFPVPTGPSASSRPMQQMRELIHMYGGCGDDDDDDDDDIPEWQPQSLNQPIAPPQQLPPPPPPPPPTLPPQLAQNFQPPNLPPQVINQLQHFVPMQQQFPQYLNQPIPVQPMNMIQVQQNVSSPWQQVQSWPHQLGPHGAPILNFGGQGQPLQGQFYGAPGFVAGQGVEWKFDVNKSRGF